MEASVIDERKVVLTLSVKEAKYIQGLVQNFLGTQDEPIEQSEYRRDIFDAIKNLNL